MGGAGERRHDSHHSPGQTLFLEHPVERANGFIQAPEDRWTGATVLVAFAIGASGLSAFAWFEHRSPHPMLDLAFFRQRRFALGGLSIAAAYFALFGMYFVFTQYLQLVRGYSPVIAGLYALPAGLAQFVVANVSKPLVARHGFRPVLAGGLLASAAGLLVLATSGLTQQSVGFRDRTRPDRRRNRAHHAPRHRRHHVLPSSGSGRRGLGGQRPRS